VTGLYPGAILRVPAAAISRDVIAESTRDRPIARAIGVYGRFEEQDAGSHRFPIDPTS
jgi:hypothetical protein